MKVEPELPNHPKYLRLRRAVGPGAAEYLLRIWGHCASNKRGEWWAGADGTYVEVISNWTGADGRLFRALCDSGFVVTEVGGVRIHDWNKTNSRAVTAWTANPTGLPKVERDPSRGPVNDGRDPNRGPVDDGRDPNRDPVRVPTRDPCMNDLNEGYDSVSEGAHSLTRPEIPSESEFMVRFTVDGMPGEWLSKQFEWFETQHAWLNGRGELVDWSRIVRSRWKKDRAIWRGEKNAPAKLDTDLTFMWKAINPDSNPDNPA